MLKPVVSVIITTKNEESVIGKLIQSLLSQTYKRCELILVDNYSTDKTIKLAKAYGVRVYNFGPERSSQRNYGVRKSKGEYVLILDADMRLEKNVINECVEISESNSNIGAVTIPEVSVARSFWEKVKAFERSFYYQDGAQIEAARFFKVKAFWDVGGYDEMITGPEDWDLPEMIVRRGYEVGRCKAKIYHYERINSLFELMKKKYYYALRSYRYFQKHSLPVISPKTIYFFRLTFYKHWKKLITNPVLSMAMLIMFGVEMLGGGWGYIQGRLKHL